MTVLTVRSTTSPAFVPVSVTVVTSGSGKLPLVDVDDDGSSAGSDGELVPPLVGREPLPPVPGRLGAVVGGVDVDGTDATDPPLAVALVDVPETGLTLVVVFERPLVERCAPRRVLAVFSAAVAPCAAAARLAGALAGVRSRNESIPRSAFGGLPASAWLTAAPAPAPAIAIVAAVAAALTQPAVDGSETAEDHCAMAGAWPEPTPPTLSPPPPRRRLRKAGSGRRRRSSP